MEATKNTAQKIWATIVRHAKEHHESVNAAVGVYYPHSATSSPVVSPVSTTASSPRSSIGKIWDGVKKHAKEHHESVSSAHAAYYGAIHGRRPSN
jgi:hypothetical protein